MQSRLGRLASTLLLAIAVAAPLAAADQPWNAAPFSADPKTLLAAANAVSSGDAGAVVLLDEATYSFDKSGRAVSTRRVLARLANDSAVEEWSAIEAPWAPWFQEKPEIAARVIDKNGVAHTLDAKAITESPAQDDLEIFSDNRIVRAPLPAIAAGSVVEQVITWKHKNPIPDAGITDRFILGRNVPVHEARLVIDAPSALGIHITNRSDAKESKSDANGTQHVVYESGPLAAIDNVEYYLPYDESPLPYIAVSTGRSWAELAMHYSEIVDKQIAGSALDNEVKAAVGGAKDKKEIVARVLAAIQKDIRYAGVEVGEGSIVPRTPREVIGHKYGDCKDKATLLVAMLRAAGLSAHVALLRAGSDLDVSPDLPGLGTFNHAIVVVDGDPQLWVDPTDEFAQAGELPSLDQGRNALVASAKTTALVQTPVFTSDANLQTETRSFKLVEEGKSSVVEITEGRGNSDSGLRREFATADKKRFRESLEQYVQEVYAAKKLVNITGGDARDLTKPFRLTVEAAEASRGISIDGESGVAIFPASLMSTLPWPLRDFPDETDSDAAKTEAARKKRTRDFVFPSPYVREYRYRITPPPGFVARTLPANETTEIGTATLKQEFSIQPDGIVLATFRFDSGKRRISASEFETMRKAVHEFRKPAFIGFDDAGKLKLASGDVAGALAEYRKMAALHPNEARHHSDIARALIAGGLGEAARAEAKKGVEIEPKSASAYRALGFTLEHDLLGRPFRTGFDLPGTLAAYRKAKELDPKDLNVRYEYAKLLEYGEDGVLFGKGAHIDDAINEFVAIGTDLKDDRFEDEIVPALARAKRFDVLREFAGKAKVKKTRELASILATTALDGSAAAIREAGSFDPARRREVLGEAVQYLLPLRMYKEVADLFDEAAKGAPDNAKAKAFVDVIHKVTPHEKLAINDSEPKGVVMRAMIGALHDGEIKKWMHSDELSLLDSEEEKEKEIATMAQLRRSEMPADVLTDLGLAAMTFTVDGDDKVGYRVRSRANGVAYEGANSTFYLTKEKDRWVISADDKDPALVGWSVLRFADAGDVESARRWLNWMRENVTRAGGDDPVAGAPFATVWPKEKPTATLDEVRLAAATLMLSKNASKRSEPILLAARDKAPNDDVRNAVDLALATLYVIRDDQAKAVEPLERVYASVPSSPSTFLRLIAALTGAGKTNEALAISKARLEKMPRDIDAVRGLGNVAMRAGDFAGAEKYFRQVVDELSPESNDYNAVAWLSLFSGKDLDKAVDDARRATDNGTRNAAALHTLAALYAETGKTLEAREMLMRRLDVAGREEPNGDDWYVLGRIAESYGVRDAALAAYKRVEKPAVPLQDDTYYLAQRRINALAAAKK